MSEVYLHKAPGKQLTFAFGVEAGPPTQQQTAESAVEALGLFCQSFVTPLSADLVLTYCEPEDGFPVKEPMPERRFWFLRSESATGDARLEAAWVNPTEQSVPVITPAVVLEWMTAAMAQNPATIQTADRPVVIGWKELLFRATRVRLPRGSELAASESIEIQDGANVVAYPIERIAGESFVSGPLKQKLLEPPIELRINSQSGLITLNVSLYWSVWTDTQQDGRSDITQAAQRLQQHGWECTYSELQYIDA